MKITGELDMSNIDSLREVLDPIVANGRPDPGLRPERAPVHRQLRVSPSCWWRPGRWTRSTSATRHRASAGWSRSPDWVTSSPSSHEPRETLPRRSGVGGRTPDDSCSTRWGCGPRGSRARRAHGVRAGRQLRRARGHRFRDLRVPKAGVVRVEVTDAGDGQPSVKWPDPCSRRDAACRSSVPWPTSGASSPRLTAPREDRLVHVGAGRVVLGPELDPGGRDAGRPTGRAPGLALVTHPAATRRLG